MTTWLIIAIVIFMTALDVAIIVGVMHFGWGELPRAFPARPPAADAVRRRYQSFRLGILNMGFAVHVAADEHCLHLTPIKPLRALGARPASIPWDEITVEKRSRSGRWITARTRTHTLTGPAWCLELAE